MPVIPTDLFGSHEQVLPLPDAQVWYVPSWLAREEADRLLAQLMHDIPWECHRLRLFGREIEAPRLSCWIGDAGASYTYSNSRFEPRSWSSSLMMLRERVEHFCGVRFNSVLANLYRDGRDSMGWHSDDEPELGPHPIIASISLGEARRFRFRRRVPRGARQAPVGVLLEHGSLLYMGGRTQQVYQHDLPKRIGVTGPRINLTFRFVHPAQSSRS